MAKFILGLGGYIGSGKTTAGSFFEKLGAQFIDADEVVDHLYEKGEDGYRKILSFFGDEYFKKNGELNRKKLGQTVFEDPKKLRILNDLIHPLVTNRIQKMVDKSSSKVIVVEATYFDKRHLKALVDAIVWIACPKDILFQRLHQERKMDRALFEKIMRFQVKPENITYTIDNDGEVSVFRSKITQLYDQLG